MNHRTLGPKDLGRVCGAPSSPPDIDPNQQATAGGAAHSDGLYRQFIELHMQQQQQQPQQPKPLHNNQNCNTNAIAVAALTAAAAATAPTALRLHSQYSMPCNLHQRTRGGAGLTFGLGSSIYGNCTSDGIGVSSNPMSSIYYQTNHSMLDERIIYCQLSLAAKKDFNEEIRALVDVRKFVADSFILTDLNEIRIGAIVETIIDRLVMCRQLGSQVAEEAKTMLFVERDTLNMVLANTMQGLYKSRKDGRLAYDNSWIVATCSLVSLHKRQVAITRFSHPVNFGRQSQEVRFLIVVLAPSKEKLTKSAWETGRTFATMFTDINFRRRLLRARCQDEFKSELLARAEYLARESAAKDAQRRLNASTNNATPAEDDTNSSSSIVVATAASSPVSTSATSSSSSLAPTSSPTSGNVILDNAQNASNELGYKQSNLSDNLKLHHYSSNNNNNSNSHGKANKNNNNNNRHHRRGSVVTTRGHSRKLNRCVKASSFNLELGSGLVNDLRRRLGYYASDFVDGVIGDRGLYKTISTTVFLYFSVLLPCIAFGVVDTNNTDGQIDPKKTMVGQALGGLVFALFSGQPLIVVMTTAPLCIYVKVIYEISQDLDIEFNSFYACVGLWMALFLIIMSITNSSNLMRFCTRSTEDIFALFTAFAFGFDGIKEAQRSFQKYYWEPDCSNNNIIATTSSSSSSLPATTVTSSASQQLGVGVTSTSGSVSSTSVLSHASSPQITTTSPNNNTALMSTLARAISYAVPTTSSELSHDAHVAGGFDTNSASPLATSDQHLLIQGSSSTGGSIFADQQQQQHQQQQHQHHLHQLVSSTANGNVDLFNVTSRCQRETCILFLFLMSGTLWLANSFSSFDKTPYLSTRKREIIKDYALAISVLIFSFIGSYLFSDIKLDVFEFNEFTGLHLAPFGSLQLRAILTACPLGFMLSVLFYIDQNICGAMVNNAPYKLKKGDYFHLDLFVLALINILLSLTGLPWMHGKLPHSHLHSKALADYEERVDDGHVHQTIVNIRETRLTGILVSLLVAISLLAVPYPLSYIPLPVLSGVFLYTAASEFKSNSMVERICLLFTEQVAYPPNHYIRRCPQRKIHLFTITQIIQLAIVCFIGFYPNPYVNMAFPLAVATFVPIRDRLLPYMIDPKYLNSLDSPSLEL